MLTKTTYRIILFIAASFASHVGANEPCQYSSWITAKQYNKGYQCAVSTKDQTNIVLFSWFKYLDGEGSFEEITSFLSHYPNIPYHNTLVKIAEEAINPKTSTALLGKWFAKYPPSTSNGIKYHSKLLLTKMKKGDKFHGPLVKSTFIKGNHDDEELEDFFHAHKEHIRDEEVLQRAITSMFQNGGKLDKRYVHTLPEEQQEFIQVIHNLVKHSSRSEEIIDSMSRQWRKHPDFLYALAMYYYKKPDYTNLTRLILDSLNINDQNGDRWFKIRQSIVADLLEHQEYSSAYKIASLNTNYDNSVNYVDMELLAGKIAYFYTNKPKVALDHFKNMLNHSKYSTSISKSAYWAGMASETLSSKTEAKEYRSKAAQYPDTFYGQLALNKLGQHHYKVDELPQPTSEDYAKVKNNLYANIASELYQYKQYSYARLFIQAASTHADTAAQKYLVSSLGKQKNVHFLSVVSSKECARHGARFFELSYPVVDLKTADPRSEKALILALIRQESEFNQFARSSANAMGLMQLVYPTAQEVAADLKCPVTKESLYRDRGLNIKLGSHYISKLLDYYNGSYVLAIAAYNAGYFNVDKWIKRHGDPREFTSVDAVVEWIEKIPFYETRNYVQNVFSNLQIYRNILHSKGHLQNLHIDHKADLLRKH